MKPVRYVVLNPSGNLTALVTEWGGAEDEAEITAHLMQESEQVAYLDPPSLPGALARIRLMGGEFCGNAAMAAAGWLVRDRLRSGEEMTVPIEVSGAQGVLFCRIRGLDDGFEGMVEMPRVLGIRPVKAGGISVTEVRMEGNLPLRIDGKCAEIADAGAFPAVYAVLLVPENPVVGPGVNAPGTGLSCHLQRIAGFSVTVADGEILAVLHKAAAVEVPHQLFGPLHGDGLADTAVLEGIVPGFKLKTDIPGFLCDIHHFLAVAGYQTDVIPVLLDQLIRFGKGEIGAVVHIGFYAGHLGLDVLSVDAVVYLKVPGIQPLLRFPGKLPVLLGFELGIVGITGVKVRDLITEASVLIPDLVDHGAAVGGKKELFRIIGDACAGNLYKKLFFGNDVLFHQKDQLYLLGGEHLQGFRDEFLRDAEKNLQFCLFIFAEGHDVLLYSTRSTLWPSASMGR